MSKKLSHVWKSLSDEEKKYYKNLQQSSVPDEDETQQDDESQQEDESDDEEDTDITSPLGFLKSLSSELQNKIQNDAIILYEQSILSVKKKESSKQISEIKSDVKKQYEKELGKKFSNFRQAIEHVFEMMSDEDKNEYLVEAIEDYKRTKDSH